MKNIFVIWVAAVWSGLLLSGALARVTANRANRNLLVSIEPNAAPYTVQYDPHLSLRSPDINANDPRVKKAFPGCAVPEQVHLTYWTPTSVLVSWASCDAKVGLGATKPLSVDQARSIVQYGTSSKQYSNSATGTTTSYSYDYSSLGERSYASPLLHHVLLKDLEPGATYFYKVLGSSPDKGPSIAEGGPSKEYNFTVPAPSFPFRLGVMADPGQTYNSSEVLKRMIGDKPQLLLLAGDFSYADNWVDVDKPIDDSKYSTLTYQPKWDTLGRLFEPLLSHVPFMHTNGNHEIEEQPNGLRNSAYNHRYPVPMQKASGPVSFPAVSKDNPFTNLFYSVELPGVFKAIFLTSYSPGQTFSPQEAQYTWLDQELQQTNRSKTPWLLVSTHAPWYNSYAGHYKENECMRQAYEPLLLKHNVDIMIFGHVHSYERSKPVANYQVDECGPVHFTIGDGGNIEGLYKDFIDTVTPKPAACSNPKAGTQFPSYQPQACLSWQQGEYCFTKQPAWSAYREPSFGHGMLEFMNATHARWKWNKNQWPAWKVADQVIITRGGSKACAAAAAGMAPNLSQ